MRDENAHEGSIDRVIGQRSWDALGLGDRSSALEGTLGEVSAFWVLCDAGSETACLQQSVAALGHRLFAWSTRLSAEKGVSPTVGSHVYLRRSIRRAGLKKFAHLPFVESLYSSYPSFDEEARDSVEALLRRNSGYALGIASPDGRPEQWVGAAQLLESHFSLSFDFENTIELESLRRRLVALYVSAAIVMGFMPIVPLNQHAVSGHVIFCASNSYEWVAGRLAVGDALPSVQEGRSSEREIFDLVAEGCDLAYL
ncbi:hypothetical protein [Streptomyces bauhiniae]|uniref:hypothetical protein n=1 Tax=Streptomyces bauhiniae TaxID=2340725 RepID=UPI0035E0C2BD